MLYRLVNDDMAYPFHECFSEDKSLLQEIAMDWFEIVFQDKAQNAINTWIFDYAYYEEIPFEQATELIMSDVRAIANRIKHAWRDALSWLVANTYIEEIQVI